MAAARLVIRRLIPLAIVFAMTGIMLSGQGPGEQQGPAPVFDISGYWTPPLHEDALDRGAGPETADYGGVPISEAGRLFALSYNTSRVTLRHHQCDGYVMPYQIRALGNARAWEERDPHTQRLMAIHWYSQTFEGHRTIWMDGRPHPPAWAPHSWMGFSTGRMVGNALEVQTTHLKQGWLRRNGLPESDQATAIEFFVRHGDRLVHTAVVNDPVFLAEPLVVTTDFFRQPVDHQTWLFACDDGEQILGRAPDDVPNYGFGSNPFVKEFGDKYKIPVAAYLGGPETMYPDYAGRMGRAADADGAAKMRPASGALRPAVLSIPNRTTEKCTSGPSAPTCISSSAMKGISSCKLAMKGHSWSTADRADCPTRLLQRFESSATSRFSSSPIPTHAKSTPAATSCFARPAPIRAFADPSSHCSSPMLASAPRYCRTRTCKTA